MKKYKKLIKKNKEIIKFGIFVLLIIVGFLLGTNLDRFKTVLPSTRVSMSESEIISASELSKELENKDFVLINVHTPYEGEISGTDSFIDYDTLVANKDKLPKDKKAKIVLYCRSGNMSSQALKTLKNMGYTNVRHLDGGMQDWEKEGNEILDLAGIPEEVLPSNGFELPISWGNMGPRLTQLGVIDSKEFEKVVNMTDVEKKILENGSDENITINSQNSQFVVDMLWAFGLAQKSLAYASDAPMRKYGNPGDYASTGGWSLAKGDATNYMGKHDLVSLTSTQQEKVKEIAENVYRPCCGNNTFFPDCNHGMAALAAIELMVNKGLSDDEIYNSVLKLNSFWFTQHYLTVATYFARQGIDWNNVDAKLALSKDYSSGQDAAALYQKVGPLPYEIQGSGSCGA